MVTSDNGPAPAFQTVFAPSTDTQPLMLMLGRLDGKVDQILLNHQSLESRLRGVEAIVVPRAEIETFGARLRDIEAVLVPRTDVDGVERRVSVVEDTAARNKGFLQALAAIWAASIALLGLTLPHFWK